MTANELLGDRTPPAEWDEMSESSRLDWIATRILAEDRTDSGITSHYELSDMNYGYGYLSEAQYERRKRREVYSEYNDLKDVTPGVFGRKYRKNRRKMIRKYNDDPLQDLQERGLLLEGDEYPVQFWYTYKILSGENREGEFVSED